MFQLECHAADEPCTMKVYVAIKRRGMEEKFLGNMDYVYVQPDISSAPCCTK